MDVPKVTIKRVKDKWMVDPSPINVVEGQQVEFSSSDSDAKISFPDSGGIDITGWETIYKDESIVKNVGKKGTYYYAVMCEDNDGKYWYAEGNSCPAMIVTG